MLLAGWPVWVRDSRVFARSQVGKMITEGRLIPNDVIEPFLTGYPAYRLSKQLMKNYPGINFTPDEEHFNYRLCSLSG